MPFEHNSIIDESQLAFLPPVSLQDCWAALRREYFPDRLDLDAYRIRWSNRKQRNTLASCNVLRRRVAVAKVLHGECYLQYLNPLLYHEMCHAALGRPKRQNGRNIFHGPEFRALEVRHPGIKELNAWLKSGGWHNAVRQSIATSQASPKAAFGIRGLALFRRRL